MVSSRLVCYLIFPANRHDAVNAFTMNCRRVVLLIIDEQLTVRENENRCQ